LSSHGERIPPGITKSVSGKRWVAPGREGRERDEGKGDGGREGKSQTTFKELKDTERSGEKGFNTG
jgi:hypothetical protein